MTVRATLLGLAMLSGGCAATGPQLSVVIGLDPAPSCRERGRVVAQGSSKEAVKADMKARAASMGCNFVQLQSVRESSGGYQADGVAFACR
jgi:hypothetical protein